MARVLEKAIIQLGDNDESKKMARNKNYKNYQNARQREVHKLKNRRELIEESIENCERLERERITREREKKQVPKKL